MTVEPEPFEDFNVGLDLLDHIRLLESVVMAATRRLEWPPLAKELGRVNALHVQQEVKALTGHVRDLQAAADRLLIDSLEGERRAEVDGHHIEVRRSWNRKWDHPMVVGAIAASTLQGERIPEVDDVVAAISTALGAATQWKTSALKVMGIDDEGYCTKELSREQVSVQ